MPGVLGAVALVVIFSFGLSWVFTTMGLLMRSPNAVMNAGFMSIFPLTFLSNVYVQPSTLPAGVEAFVNVNPFRTWSAPAAACWPETSRRTTSGSRSRSPPD